MQIGFELIGALTAEADAEAIRLGITALAALGITDISVDILLPTLVPSLLDAAKASPAQKQAIAHALDRKDSAALEQAASGLDIGATLSLLLHSSGDAARALKTLQQLQLPPQAVADRTRLEDVMALLKDVGTSFTVDLVEGRHFEYQTGLSFSFFSKGGQAELGRGGRYRTGNDEPATGLTFYSDALMQVMAEVEQHSRLMVPFDLTAAEAARLQKEGYVLVTALDKDAPTHAAAHGCTHIWDKGSVRKL